MHTARTPALNKGIGKDEGAWPRPFRILSCTVRSEPYESLVLENGLHENCDGLNHVETRRGIEMQRWSVC